MAPLDEAGWTKSSVLHGDNELIVQDINNKIQDVIVCINNLNQLYGLLKSMLSDYNIDDSKKVVAGGDSVGQVWGGDDFQNNIREIEVYLEDMRQYNISCVEIVSIMNGGVQGEAYSKVHSDLETICGLFNEGGLCAEMERKRIGWVKAECYSIQVWSEILHQRLNKAVGMFDDVSEFIFLSDRVFPFILNQISILSEENRNLLRGVEELLSDWKDLSVMITGLEMKLNHLESKLESKWVEGYKEIKRLLIDVNRLKRLIGNLWGEASTTRIYKRISDQLESISYTISKPPAGMRNLRSDMKDLEALAKSVFDLVVVYNNRGRLRRTREPLFEVQNSRRERDEDKNNEAKGRL